MPRRRPTVGDIIEIPLSDAKYAYCQYVLMDQNGPMIKVFDMVTDRPLSDPVAEVAEAKEMFPPVITGLFAATSKGEWRIVAHSPLKDFEHPGFVSTLYDQETGRARTWVLWDGTRDVRLGNTLPPEYRHKEFLVVWPPADVVERIQTGQIPFPYDELVKKGRFDPRPRASHPANEQ